MRKFSGQGHRYDLGNSEETDYIEMLIKIASLLPANISENLSMYNLL